MALYDMSSIDTYLRSYLFDLCLDIEHISKTKLMTHLTKNKFEDGYTILDEFKNEFPYLYNKAMSHFSGNKYKKEMYRKRKNEVSVWVFLEIIDFGTLNRFIEFYISKYPDFNKVINHSDLQFIKNIRNSCAHNDVYFINFFNDKDKIERPRQRTVSLGKEIKIGRNSIQYHKIHDLVVLFSVHKKNCSLELNQRRFKEGKIVMERVKKNIQLYDDSLDYHSGFFSINKCIDHLNK